MPRHVNPDLIARWKIGLPATLAGRVEFMLLDPITSKPIYAARARLIERCLEHWVAIQSGNPNPPPLPTLAELRETNVSRPLEAFDA